MYELYCIMLKLGEKDQLPKIKHYLLFVKKASVNLSILVNRNQMCDFFYVGINMFACR